MTLGLASVLDGRWSVEGTREFPVWSSGLWSRHTRGDRFSGLRKSPG